MRLFISYPGRDLDLLELLSNKIKFFSNELPFELEVIQPDRNFVPGEAWSTRLREELEAADIFFFLLTENSDCSKGQLIEVGIAWWLRKPVVPILYDFEHTDLPWYLRDFHALHWSDLDSSLVPTLIQAQERL